MQQQQHNLSTFHYYSHTLSLGAKGAKQPVSFLWAIYVFSQIFGCRARNARLAGFNPWSSSADLLSISSLFSVSNTLAVGAWNSSICLFSYSSWLLHSSSFFLCIYTSIIIDPVIFCISFTVNASIIQLCQLCLFISNSCISPQQCLHFAICIYENTIVVDYSKNSVATHSGSHFLSFNGCSAPEEIIFFANLEAKTSLFFMVVFCLAQ